MSFASEFFELFLLVNVVNRVYCSFSCVGVYIGVSGFFGEVV